jgi:hypothetical protein
LLVALVVQSHFRTLSAASHFDPRRRESDPVSDGAERVDKELTCKH